MRILLALATLVGSLSYSTVAAADNDYLVDHRGWNGLSMLAGLGRGLGLEVVPRTSIEWDALDSQDVVLVLYPTERLEPNHVVRFIRNGGRVLLADDFGRADEAIERLSMLRKHGIGVGASTFYDKLAFAPMAKPVLPSHPLAAGVEELACNHPAVLSDVRGHDTVFAFAQGEAVVVAGDIGYGRFVVLSDPSVLINRMLEFEGNFRFAQNLLQYLGRRTGIGRIIILTGDFKLRGEPTEIYEGAGEAGSAAQSVAGINAWLEGLNDYFLTEWSLKIIAVLVALVIAGLAASSLPLKSRVDVSGDWTRARPDAESPQDFAAIVADFDDGGGGRRSYELPAAILRDSIVRQLSQATGIGDPLIDDVRTRLYQELRSRAGADAAAAYQKLERTLKNLPTRAQAASPWQPMHVSKREFDRLVADASRLYRTLGVDDGS